MRKTKICDKACCKCAHFKQYYETSFHNFEVTEYGLCEIKNQTVKRIETCNDFYKRRVGHITTEEVDFALNELRKLKKLIK